MEVQLKDARKVDEIRTTVLSETTELIKELIESKENQVSSAVKFLELKESKPVSLDGKGQKDHADIVLVMMSPRSKLLDVGVSDSILKKLFKILGDDTEQSQNGILAVVR
ncbi:hypothetical protein C0584_04590 [Candidatus Parcubacteria bacterium]|nr:MAG: hypothetical protein C0584_04590 [Candidatus Parcubacteria bacterium]